MYVNKKMKINEANKIVIKIVAKILSNKVKVTKEMQLIGGNSKLDSMKLVEVCVALEDIAEEYGFEFDWTSATTMSKSKSMFRNVNALAKEFAKQSEV
tara:strand:- start:2274 stop:2567 length:294 start_codon:yes stop_codon:yes gene_type:complete